MKYKTKQNEKLCIKAVNLNFASLNTFYVISVHPLEKYHIQWRLCHGVGVGVGRAERKGGRTLPRACLSNSFLSLVLTGRCPVMPDQPGGCQELSEICLHCFPHCLHSAPSGLFPCVCPTLQQWKGCARRIFEQMERCCFNVQAFWHWKQLQIMGQINSCSTDDGLPVLVELALIFQVVPCLAGEFSSQETPILDVCEAVTVLPPNCLSWSQIPPDQSGVSGSGLPEVILSWKLSAPLRMLSQAFLYMSCSRDGVTVSSSANTLLALRPPPDHACVNWCSLFQ